MTAEPCSTTGRPCDDAEPSPRSQPCVEDARTSHCSRICAWACDACSEAMILAEDKTDPVDPPDVIEAAYHALADTMVELTDQAESLGTQLLTVATLDRSAALFVQDCTSRTIAHLRTLDTAVSARLTTLDGA